MKVILLQELKGKGGEGDVVDVAPGFANNYLLPQKVAILATKGNLKQLEQRKHNIAKREENRLADAGKIKETLDGALVKVEAKVGEEGQLFGSVTAQMIADAIKAATDVDVDRRRIELGHAIKTAGRKVTAARKPHRFSGRQILHCSACYSSALIRCMSVNYDTGHPDP